MLSMEKLQGWLTELETRVEALERRLDRIVEAEATRLNALEAAQEELRGDFDLAVRELKQGMDEAQAIVRELQEVVQ